MANITGAWYQAVNNPQDATSLVGGAINTGDPVVGLLDEVFEVGKSRFLGKDAYERFRKVFFQNTGNQVDEAVVFWQDLEHVNQMKFALEKVADDTSANSETMPVGYVTGDFISPIGLAEGSAQVSEFSIAAATGQVALWVWERIPNGLTPETGALAKLRIAGVVQP